MGTKNKILEWSSLMIHKVATDVTPENHKINLALRDDEIAEIHKIHIETDLQIAATTTAVQLDFAMSMDPDIVSSPGIQSTYEDMEVFYAFKRFLDIKQLVADIDQIIDTWKREEVDFKVPILVGTNIGVSSEVTWLTADSSAYIRLKVFFTRRKANIQELNQILLKRR